MPFYSLLNPVNDESFTSWIRRCELKLSPRLFSSTKINSMFYSNIDCFPILDPDFSVDTLVSTSVNDTIKVDPQILLNLFRPRTTWVIPFSDWQNACTACLMESLKKKGCYVFLKSWRYTAHPICSVHQCLLSPLPYKQRNSIMAFPEKYIATHKCTLDSLSLKKLVLLALKIQRHIYRLENSTDNSALEIMAAYRFVMELFLCAGEYRGLACFLYSKPTPQRGALKHSGARSLMLIGAYTASSFERMCALILTGYVIGAFSQLDTRAFESISNEHSSLYSCTAYDIGRFSRIFPSDESPAIRRRLEKLCSVFPSRNYLDFLKGFENE
jgi:hypothetical protein